VAERVLIYRLGTLGDTVIALPCFHLIARIFSKAERRLLTNETVSSKAAAPASVLGDSGLVHSYLSYAIGVRDIWALKELSASIRIWQPDLLVYLAEPRGIVKLIRDALFFRLSGITKFVGLPWPSILRRHRWLPDCGCYESEAARLARCIQCLGEARLDDPASWDLRLSRGEATRARELLHGWTGKNYFLACCLGTKFETNDWGLDNWRRLLARVGSRHPGLGLLLIGATREKVTSSEAAAEWRGPIINLCGITSPRETAALLQLARVFVGHDSGPMHLAASVGIPCVAIFSARNRAGVWFPPWDNNRIIYHHVPCEGCGLERCIRFKKLCIRSVEVGEVFEAITGLLAEPAGRQVLVVAKE
jgi:heptosyltransferase-3